MGLGKRWWIFVLVVVVAGALVWLDPLKEKPYVCPDKLGCVVVAPFEPLKLGVIQALSGRVATLGLEQVRGLELALARRANMVHGHQVNLQMEDTGCKPEGGATAALKIVSDPAIAAIFGTTCSGDAATAAEVMSEAGLSMISGNNSAPFLTAIGGQKAPKWQPGFFRTAPNEESAGPAAARYAYERLGARKAAVVNDGDIYTRGLTDGFRKEFERLGGTIVLHGTVSKGESNMEPIITSIVNAQAGLVFFPLFQPDGNNFLLQARKTPAMRNVVLMSDGALIDSTFITAVQEASVGMYFVGPAPAPQGPLLDELSTAYQTKYQMVAPTMYYVSAYDAANILLDALEKVAVVERNGTMHIGRQALRDALYATAGHKGVGGTMQCNDFGDCAPVRFNVLRMDDPAAGVEGLKANIVYSYAPAQ